MLKVCRSGMAFEVFHHGLEFLEGVFSSAECEQLSGLILVDEFAFEPDPPVGNSLAGGVYYFLLKGSFGLFAQIPLNSHLPISFELNFFLKS